MVKKLQVYRCEVCGNITLLLYSGGGELVCCRQPMKLLPEKTVDQGKEKHVPEVKRDGNEVKVKVGLQPHPMEENHFIQWIEAVTDNRTYIEFLKPGNPAEAVFRIEGNILKIRAYCNLHHLWKKEI